MTTAIYARQSIDKKDSISIETQIDLCRKELSPGEDFKVYSDKGFSGKNTNRPEFQEMMSEVKAGNISRIIIYRLDRISRSISDFASIMDILEKYEVSFTSVNEKFDTSTPMGRAMLYIIMVFAQLERETIAERITDNYYQRGKTGVWLGGPAAFGFKNEKVIIDGKRVSTVKPTKEMDIIKYIFDEYSSTSKSLGKIAKELTDLYGKTYGIWNNIKLSRLLHNPIYVKANADIYNYYKERGCTMVNSIEEYTGINGLSLYGKREKNAAKFTNVEAQIVALSISEGVIEPDVFLACQHKLSKNKQIKNTGKGKHSYLTGLMKCGHCGYSMTVKLFDNKKYLYCSGHQTYHICPIEKPQTVLLSDIEETVDSLVFDYLKSIDKEDISSRSSADENKANQLKIKLYKINEQIDKLISSLMELEGAATEYVNRKINELDSEKQSLVAEINALASPAAVAKIPTPDEWENADMEEKRDLSHLIIEQVNVFNDSNIEIVWKF